MLSGLCILACFMFSLHHVFLSIFLLPKSYCFPLWESIVSVIIKKNQNSRNINLCCPVAADMEKIYSIYCILKLTILNVYQDIDLWLKNAWQNFLSSPSMMKWLNLLFITFLILHELFHFIEDYCKECKLLDTKRALAD